MSELTNVPIVDKNGVITSRNKNLGKAQPSSGGRLIPTSPPPTGLEGHDILMRVGEVRSMPITGIEFGSFYVRTDSGVPHIILDASEPFYMENQSDRVSFLASYTSLSGLVERLPDDVNADGGVVRQYKVQMFNPSNDELLEHTWTTGALYNGTPKIDSVIDDMLNDARTVCRGQNLPKWAKEQGWVRDARDNPLNFWKQYSECSDAHRELYRFLGDLYDDYLWYEREGSTASLVATARTN